VTCRPDHPARHEDFAEGNLARVRHGAYSPRKQAERAELVLRDLLASRPDLGDPELLLPLQLFARATAAHELAHEGLENAAASGSAISARLLEAASSAARAAHELGAELGVGPLAQAQLRQVKAQTALSLATLAREAPSVIAALRQTLAVLGLSGRVEEFSLTFAEQLALVAGDDDED
jgi:hypothetical protein